MAPSFSKGIVGAGMNALVLGTGSTSLGDRHTAFATEVTDIWRGKETFSFDGIYRLTSLTQQVAVFWRTMARSLYNVTMWTLSAGAKIPGLATPVAKGLALFEHAAATPVGRTMTFLNKWIPLLNAAWIMMAAKTAWQTCHDTKASTTSKTLSVASVAVSIAAVWAGLATSGFTFMAVTFGSIVLDLLLAQTRHHDKTAGDSDAVARHLLTHPVQLATVGAQWSADVVRVIGGRMKGLWNRLWGKPSPAAQAPAKAAESKPQRVIAPSNAAEAGRGWAPPVQPGKGPDRALVDDVAQPLQLVLFLAPVLEHLDRQLKEDLVANLLLDLLARGLADRLEAGAAVANDDSNT